MQNFIILSLIFQGVSSTPQGVKFEYYNPQAKAVYLAGDFNNWSTTSHPMRRESDGTFWIVVKLAPGKYEYKFVVDGQWTADPDNPVTVGVYGNSLVRVGENYAVLPPEMATNTPVSSIVNFNIDARGYLKADKDSIEGGKAGYRVFDYMQDVKIDLDANLEDKADLWVRIRYNTNTDREQQTQLIPLKFERGFFTLKGGTFNFYAFYNAHKIAGPDPFSLLREVGEFRRDFGDGEQGVVLNLNKFLIFDNTYLAYSNNILQDRDLFYSNIGKNLGKLNLGIVYRGQRGLEKLYRVPSPDSLKSNDTLLYFNTYENENLYGGYLTFDAKRFLLTAGGLIGNRVLNTGEKYSGDTPYPVHLSWQKSKIIKGLFSIKGFTGKWINSAWVNYEKHYYDKLFVRGGSQLFKYWRFGYSNSYNGYLGFNFRYTILKTDSFMNWKYLFEDLENQRLDYGEFPLISYPHYLTLNPYVKWRFKNLGLRYELKWNAYAINQKPYTLENLFHIDLKIWKPILTYELRTYTVKSSLFGLENTYVDHFAEIAYPISKSAMVSLNYGYLPWNLEDEYFARREYLIEQGVDYSLLVNNFRGLGTFLDLAETSLSKERGIQLWLKIAF